MYRRRTPRLFALLATAGVLAVAGCSGTQSTPAGGGAATPIRFAMNWYPLADHAAYYVALNKGWYSEAGLDVEILQGSSTSDALRRIDTGQAEIGVGDVTAIINGIRNGSEVKMVASTIDQGISTIWTSANSGIKTIPDLAGHTIGAPVGDAGRALFPALAEANGLDPDAVEWVDLQASAKFQALGTGSVDAIADTWSGAPFIFTALGGEKNAVSMRYSDFGIDLYGHSIFTSDALTRSNPQAVSAFVGASMRGWQYVLQNPADSMQILKTYVAQVDVDQYVENLKYIADNIDTERIREHGLGWIDTAKMGSTVEILQKYFDAPKDITDPSTIFTTEFLTRYDFPQN